jgi:hypothetical protein
MSANEILLIDAMSGDAVLVFNSLSGIVTALAFHDADLLVSTIGGTLMRWTIPQHVQNELQVKQLFAAPDQDGAAPLISTSLMTSVEAERPPLIDADDAIEEAQPEVGESDDPPNSPRVEEDIDAPRDPLDNTDKRINDFIRSSFVARRNPVRLRLSSDDEPEVLRLFPGEMGRQKPVAIDMPPEIQPISDAALKSMMNDSLLNDDDDADDDVASSAKSKASTPPEIDAPSPERVKPNAPDLKRPKEPAQEPKKSPPRETRKSSPSEPQPPPADDPKNSPPREPRKSSLPELPRPPADESNKPIYQEPAKPPSPPEPTQSVAQEPKKSSPQEPTKPSPSDPQKASLPNAVTPLSQEPKKLLLREPTARSPVKAPDAKKLLSQEPRRPPPADGQEAKRAADAKREPAAAVMATRKRPWGDGPDAPLPEPARIAPPEVKRSIHAAPRGPNLADQIRETTAELRQLFEDARVVLSKEYADEPERAAQQRMRQVIESIDTERQAREERTSRILSVLSRLRSNVTGISGCLDSVARDSDSLVGLLS